LGRQQHSDVIYCRQSQTALLGKGMKMNYTEQSSRIIAGCYCRLSDDDDRDGTSVSIETQMRILSDYCREHHFTVYDQYCDDGFTGTNFNRPSFKRMMRDAENGLINAIIVKDYCAIMGLNQRDLETQGILA